MAKYVFVIQEKLDKASLKHGQTETFSCLVLFVEGLEDAFVPTRSSREARKAIAKGYVTA